MLSRLSLRHFRNLGVQDLEFPAEGVAIVGENAQGKTNLLEAIYYLETFRSFRGSTDEQLVAFGEPLFRVAAEIEGEEGAGTVRLSAAYARAERRKKIGLEGEEPERIGDALGKVGAVLFSPSDVGLVSEGPSERRRYLDILLSLNVPGYLRSLQRFRQVLAQRNAALREEAPEAVVRIWDAPLAEAGARILVERGRWLEDHRDAFAGYCETISAEDAVRIDHRSDILPSEGETRPGSGEVEALYLERLERGGERDRRNRTTSVGPHRDDLALEMESPRGWIAVREYGSGGQRRTAALALRLVEADTIRAARSRSPLLLLDDLFAELDEGRGERVLQLLEERIDGQLLLTAPREGDVRLRRDSLTRWRIRNGGIAG